MAIDDAVIHKCPQCFTKYNKEDGCNLMTCPTCHSYSCYLCGILIRPRGGIKYWHFKGSGSADANATYPLYNNDNDEEESIRQGNIRFNQQKVSKALTDLLSINRDDPEITKALEKEVERRGYRVHGRRGNEQPTVVKEKEKKSKRSCVIM